MQAERHLGPEVLRLAAEVPRIEGGRRAAAKGTAVGEQPAEANHRRAGTRNLDAERPCKSHNGEPAATSLRGQGPAARQYNSVILEL